MVFPEPAARWPVCGAVCLRFLTQWSRGVARAPGRLAMPSSASPRAGPGGWGGGPRPLPLSHPSWNRSLFSVPRSFPEGWGLLFDVCFWSRETNQKTSKQDRHLQVWAHDGRPARASRGPGALSLISPRCVCAWQTQRPLAGPTGHHASGSRKCRTRAASRPRAGGRPSEHVLARRARLPWPRVCRGHHHDPHARRVCSGPRRPTA